jgi:hypothetical protein
LNNSTHTLFVVEKLMHYQLTLNKPGMLGQILNTPKTSLAEPFQNKCGVETNHQQAVFWSVLLREISLPAGFITPPLNPSGPHYILLTELSFTGDVSIQLFKLGSGGSVQVCGGNTKHTRPTLRSYTIIE